MRETDIIFGPPGTGKTTYLLDQIEQALKNGIDPDRIAFFAFTRKAASEARERAFDRFGLTESDLPWFRTLHSTAFAMIGMSLDQTMQREHYDELSSSLGTFVFSHTYKATMERIPITGALGDVAMGVYSLARARQESVEDTWTLLKRDDITLRDALRFSAALDDYKRCNHLMDFNDIIDEAQGAIDLDLLIIDEAQDLTRQQWAFARRVGARSKRVVIAGDDDQAIFEWGGADVRAFLSFKGNLSVLPVSHRLPSSIFDVACGISNRIKYRKSKEWSPRDDKGAVTNLDSEEGVSLKDTGDWFMLARTGRDLHKFKKVCQGQGVVYHADGQWSNEHPTVKAVVSYERLRRGNTITQARAQIIARYVPNMERPSKELHTISWDDMDWPFEGDPNWMSALTAIGGAQREYIRRLKREGESLIKPGRVTISTIHGAKGGEADNVLLLSDTNKRIALQKETDSEHRVWYVAASRAKKALHIVKPRRAAFYTF